MFSVVNVESIRELSDQALIKEESTSTRMNQRRFLVSKD